MDEQLIEKQPHQPYINLDCREKALLINLEPEEGDLETMMKEDEEPV